MSLCGQGRAEKSCRRSTPRIDRAALIQTTALLPTRRKNLNRTLSWCSPGMCRCDREEEKENKKEKKTEPNDNDVINSSYDYKTKIYIPRREGEGLKIMLYTVSQVYKTLGEQRQRTQRQLIPRTVEDFRFHDRSNPRSPSPR